MFYADLYASIIASKMQTCQQLKASGAKFELPDNEDNGACYQLPPRFITSLATAALEACNASYPVVFVKDGRTELLAQRVAQNASIQRVAVNSQWTLYEDRPTKFGWIVEGVNISSTNELPMIFPLNQTEVAPLIRGDHSVRLRVNLMRTHNNAGVAKLYLCDQYVGLLDSLWRDYRHYKYSRNDDVYFNFNKGMPQCANAPNPSIKIVRIEDSAVPAEQRIPDSAAARGTSKLKISTVELCLSTVISADEAICCGVDNKKNRRRMLIAEATAAA
jgi:hypothetical protein